MRLVSGSLTVSPSDLSGFLGCRHRTGLDLAVAHGALPKPDQSDPFVALLRQRGAEHEARYVDSLRTKGLTVVALTMDDGPERTIEAMRAGVEAIVQANLATDGWSAYADVLRRVESPSAEWPWSYEVVDTKLARETRGATILQLSVYSELLQRIQGTGPQHFHVISPGAEADNGGAFAEHRYRVADFVAYYRLVRARFLAAVATPREQLLATHYPEPVAHCEVCRWWSRCHARRRADDHLSFVAGAGRLQRTELAAQGVTTLAAAAAMPLPIAFTPTRGSKETFAALREQARLQHQQRATRTPQWTLLPVQDDRAAAEQGPVGLRRLPAPSSHDIFLDLESARFAREGGREYLFGVWRAADYTAYWATSDAEERAAFESVVDLIMAAWQADPGMHVYHFGHHEPSAFKRLMGRYATRADEIDRLLRGARFVDLHAIVRQSLRAGVEHYSLKQLEQYYAFTREVALQDAAAHLHALELALEMGAASTVDEDVCSAVRGYNRDDCRSTHALRDWLERIRAQAEAAGTSIPRPAPKESEASARVTALQAEVDDLRRRLLEEVPADIAEHCDADRARWLLAYLIDWHRRADKAEWWEFYRLCELPEDALLDERKAVAGLQRVARVEVKLSTRGKPTGTVTDRYSFPEQDIEINAGDELKLQDETARLGTVVAIDRLARTIDIEKGPSVADLHPRAAFVHRYVDPTEMQRAIMRLAHGLLVQAPVSPRGCGFDLLFRRTPRLRAGRLNREPAESDVARAVRIVADLDATTLAIQGPPGAGKTHTGAQMIRALVAAGRRVGVTANSHKVIRNLLREVQAQAAADEQPITLGHKVGSGEPVNPEGSTIGVREYTDNPSPLAALRNREIDVLGGTPFLWARAEYEGSVDVLFVDEAGQMSLANALAISHAAESLVLLGDPQQLEQPQKGVHPDGVNISALEHVLGEAETMPADHGLFLPTTWRLAPAICRFTSEVFYEGKLHPKPGLERQALIGTDIFDGAGLWLVPVDHDDRQTSSPEEVECVDRIVTRLLSGARWVRADGIETPLRPEDFRVVAPYNAQVNRLIERLGPRGIPIGTVDKFQGQTAAVAIYSMTTSRAEDAPHGMEFLYSMNRLNVATSRARCAVFLVASPRLFEPECRTPRQMQLANALCRYREMAREVDIDSVVRLKPDPTIDIAIDIATR